MVPDPNDACYLPSRSSMTAANPRWLEELPLLKLERPVRMRALSFERGEVGCIAMRPASPAVFELLLRSFRCQCVLWGRQLKEDRLSSQLCP